MFKFSILCIYKKEWSPYLVHCVRLFSESHFTLPILQLLDIKLLITIDSSIYHKFYLNSYRFPLIWDFIFALLYYSIMPKSSIMCNSAVSNLKLKCRIHIINKVTYNTNILNLHSTFQMSFLYVSLATTTDLLFFLNIQYILFILHSSLYNNIIKNSRLFSVEEESNERQYFKWLYI